MLHESGAEISSKLKALVKRHRRIPLALRGCEKPDDLERELRPCRSLFPSQQESLSE